MSTGNIPSNPLPFWMKLIIIVMALPVLAFPTLLSLAESTSIGNLILFYPVYILLAAVLEWRCWAQRPEITWVLLAVELLTHIALFLFAVYF